MPFRYDIRFEKGAKQSSAKGGFERGSIASKAHAIDVTGADV